MPPVLLIINSRTLIYYAGEVMWPALKGGNAYDERAVRIDQNRHN